MQEIIEKLKSVKLSILTHPDCEIDSEFEDMVDLLDEVIGDLINPWIPVANRLPERNENVLLKRAKPFHLYHATGFQRDGVFYSNTECELKGRVIAWAYLPE